MAASRTHTGAGLLHRFRSGSIGLQFTLIVVASVAVTTAAVAAAAYTTSRRFALSEAQRRVDLAVLVEASRLRDVLVDRSRTVGSWGRLEVMRALAYGDVDKQIVQFLERSLAGSPEVTAVACTNRSGALVAGAGDSETIKQLVLRSPGSFGIVTVGERRLLGFSAPVALADSPRERLGRVLLAVDPRRLLEGGAGGAGAAHQLTLLDGQRRPMATTGDAVAATPAEAADEAITAVAPIEWEPAVARRGLYLSAAEPARVALAPARALQRSIAQAGLLVLAVASLLGALVAMRISRPIRLFTEAVERIRERGRLSGPLDLPSGNAEIDSLAESFTRMAHTLTLAEERNLAQSRLALLGEVAANVAHEVRTPLSSLRSAGQMLADQDQDTATRQRLGALIVSEADRLHRVVSDLVQTARPPSGRRLPCRVSGLLDRAVATLEPLLAEQGATIRMMRTKPVAPALFVDADADQMQQILLNVLRNALDAGGRDAVVDVAVHDSGDGSVELEIRDNGPGFAEAVLARPFAPFQTTKQGGTGLGLAIARRMAEEHGGRITLANHEGGGARVRIRLPQSTSAGHGNGETER